MPVNVEIKARATDWAEQVRRGLALADRTERLFQDDTFFNCANGRLKLRRERGAGARLIFYRRAGLKGPKTSDYVLLPVRDGASALKRLTRALGAVKRVLKKRLVCHAGRTRIHFDEVRGLGRFIELEVVLRQGESAAAGRREAARLMRALGIRRADLLAGAYADMPADHSRRGPRC
ncbi:MAG: class IV adenylate cyclase [Elusimicrobia bacterium]|nr:class IV adenylate cyclase [Elusimicrobiota bacterium]